MALIYFFRHGQAGTRDDYDRLSPLGRRQAELLGGWIARQRLQFSAVISGALRRQQETAGIALPLGFDIDPGWNEFDLDAVYAQIAPQLATEDAVFRAHWDELQRSIAAGDDGIHRRWTAPDAAVVEAWVKGRYSIEAESWPQFNARVAAAASRFAALDEDACIAVFTSATPISITLGNALGGLPPRRVLRFAGASLNTGITIFRAHGGELDLFTFNAVPHLDDPALRTFR